MKQLRSFTFFFCLVSTLFIVSCGDDSDNKKATKIEDEQVPNNPNNPTPTPDPNTGDPGICSQTGFNQTSGPVEDYHRFPAIGRGKISHFGWGPMNFRSDLWSSSYGVFVPVNSPGIGSGVTQGDFIADSQLRFRFVVKSAPSANVFCTFSDAYNWLSFKVGIRAGGTDPSTPNVYTHSFQVNELSMDSGSYATCSNVYTVPASLIPPNGGSNLPFVVDILDAKWDKCLFGEDSCNVFDHSCFEVEVQMDTDYTWDLVQ